MRGRTPVTLTADAPIAYVDLTTRCRFGATEATVLTEFEKLARNADHESWGRR